MNNIVEEYRKMVVKNLFSINSFSEAWPLWKQKINMHFKDKSVDELTQLGSNLSEVFKSTRSGRNQSSVSKGGQAWENLVCWYLNLCTIGSKTVVVKPALLPPSIKDAITVNYGSFISNTEADIVAITFLGKEIDVDTSKSIIKQADDYIHQHLDKIEIHIIQCKTNWNDNAQIPMLWDMIYKVRNFENNNIAIGRNNFSIKDCHKFSYSFVTVPTVKLEKFKENTRAVKRVSNLSGGVFWGEKTKSGVAKSIGELPLHVFFQNQNIKIREVLQTELKKLDTTYKYFDI